MQPVTLETAGVNSEADASMMWAEEGAWECMDDGTGRNVLYIHSRTKEKTRILPPDFIPELHINGQRKYRSRGICVRCRSPAPVVAMLRERASYCFSYNYCGSCLLATAPHVPSLKGHGNELWASHQEQNTPLNTLVDCAANFSHPMRDEYLLQRSKEAFFEVNTSAKLRRNEERHVMIKRRAQQSGVFEGVFISWGFGTTFDEYFGQINTRGDPHGFGMKIYSDESVYVGEWYNGMRFTKKKSGHWTRDDGLQYEGTWWNDMRHGSGEMRYPDGTVYRGEFAKNYEHGHGVKTFLDGSRFEGRFRFGNRDGPGALTSPDGQVEKRVFRESEVFYEKPIPRVVEMVNEEEENVKLFQPESLISIATRAVAGVMHNKVSLVPANVMTHRLSDYLKPSLVDEFVRTVHPIGTVDFRREAPLIGFLLQSTIALRHVKFKNYDAESFLYLTTGNSALSDLQLVNNRLDATSIDQISKRIANASWPLLESLDLSFNKIDAVNLKSLTLALRATPRIRVLRLSGCGITANGALTISSLLESNQTIQELDLSFNAIQAIGAESIASSLTKNTTLTSLNMRQNNLGILGGEALVEAMRYNNTLRVLSIVDNKCGADIVSQLAARLRGSIRNVFQSVCVDQLDVPVIHRQQQHS